MKKAVAACVVLVAILVWGFWETSRTNASWLSTVYGTGSGPSAKEDEYWSEFRSALDRHLQMQGSVGVRSGTPWGGFHAGTETTMDYRLAGRTALPLHVLVTSRSGSAHGVSVNLLWEFVGFRWNREADEAGAREVQNQLIQWTEEYVRAHPKP